MGAPEVLEGPAGARVVEVLLGDVIEVEAVRVDRLFYNNYNQNH